MRTITQPLARSSSPQSAQSTCGLRTLASNPSGTLRSFISTFCLFSIAFTPPLVHCIHPNLPYRVSHVHSPPPIQRSSLRGDPYRKHFLVVITHLSHRPDPRHSTCSIDHAFCFLSLNLFFSKTQRINPSAPKSIIQYIINAYFLSSFAFAFVLRLSPFVLDPHSLVILVHSKSQYIIITDPIIPHTYSTVTRSNILRSRLSRFSFFVFGIHLDFASPATCFVLLFSRPRRRALYHSVGIHLTPSVHTQLI
ncbi:hypothetical protein BDN70DRAFT_616202 [Pholiota conissans]|uniref:Uncharacterized protein n=1 Tax=Pholiota conissans TaxID=109636 RepID=A0A9P5Z495_9AGAR|nr:hypothetical protein BDN70DRAFT_616202 [Pholiota conissans]